VEQQDSGVRAVWSTLCKSPSKLPRTIETAERLATSKSSFSVAAIIKGYDMINRRDVMLGGLAGAAALGFGRVNPISW